MEEEDNYSIKRLMKQMVKLLAPESSFYIIALIYSLGVGVLTLAIPISVQSLVNTVTFGVLNQPLVVISIILLGLLSFSGVLHALQTFTIELFQRHFYARVSTDMATKILNSDYSFIRKKNGAELVNRYFDIMTVQKSGSSLLIGGVAVVIQTIVGLLLLAFYHPYFLIFDAILVFFIWLVWIFYGRKALASAIDESTAKYNTASWLEELAKNNLFFKTSSRRIQAVSTTDGKILNYLNKRRKHFRFVLYQVIWLLIIYAIMSSLLLGLGGFLVMIGELTLGQLVAAELVVTVILANFSRSGKYLETFYDLFAASHKINKIYSITQIEEAKVEEIETDNYNINFKNVNQIYDDNDLIMNKLFEFNKNYQIKIDCYSAKIIFLDLIQGLINPKKGRVMFGEYSYEDLNVVDLRELIYVVNKPYIIEATVEENLTYGNPCTVSEINEALEIVELDDLENIFEQSLKTPLKNTGYPFLPSQHIRLEIARAILKKPKIVVLTEAFEQIEERQRLKILKHFIDFDTTLIYLTTESEKIEGFDELLRLTTEGLKE